MTERDISEPGSRSRLRLSRVAEAIKLSRLLHRRRFSLVILGTTAAAAGIAEASLLALISCIATAMASATRPMLDLGPFSVTAPTRTLLIAAAALAITRLLLQLVLARLPARMSGESQTLLRSRIFDAFANATWAQKTRESGGRLQELMGGHTLQAGSVILYLASGLAAGFMFIALTGAALMLSGGLAIVVMATGLALFACLRPLSRRVRRSAAMTSAASVAQASAVADSVRTAEEVQVFGVLASERAGIMKLIHAVADSYVRTRTLSRIVPVAYQGVVLILIVIGLGVLEFSEIAPGRLASLGAVILLLVRASSYGQQLQASYQGIAEALPYLERVVDTIEQYRSERRSIGTRPIQSIERIALQSVSFAYGDRSPVFENMSLSISSGEAVGVAGPSGAGKSTLVQLLLRLRDPVKGFYLINDMPARSIDDDTWSRKVSYLPQEPHLLLQATVAENIRFFRDSIDNDEIEVAAKLAHMHEDVLSWPDGYSSVIGERFDSVSGGQRQRLCLARALAGRPELLVLDEPTSSLDLHSEDLIRHSLEQLAGTITLVIVAHRLATLRVCDRVVVIRDGQLQQFTPTAGIEEFGNYYRDATGTRA